MKKFIVNFWRSLLKFFFHLRWGYDAFPLVMNCRAIQITGRPGNMPAIGDTFMVPGGTGIVVILKCSKDRQFQLKQRYHLVVKPATGQ